MNQKVKISSRQKQIIVGKLLGDGCLETANGKTYRLKFQHGWSQKAYVDWLYEELQDIASSFPKIKYQKVNNKEYVKYWFNTSYTPSLRFYAHQFYRNRRKIVPKFIVRWLTPLAVAIWFMDDGSIKSKDCRARYINTQCYDDVSLKMLQEAFEKNYHIKTTLRKQLEGKQIYIPSSEISKFYNVISDYIIPSMKYKLG